MISSGEIITRGFGASPGVASGRVALATSPAEALSKLGEDSILVAPNTDPSWTIAMRNAKAIVTVTGGLLCHAAIVAREVGIPCVVGATDALAKLKDSMRIVVDGSRGEIRREG